MKKVLVLEDESSIRSFVVINLKRSGYEPIEAATGVEAFQQLKQHPHIKLALLDVILPDTDGFEVSRKAPRTISEGSSFSSPPTRRYRASTRAVSSAMEARGCVT